MIAEDEKLSPEIRVMLITLIATASGSPGGMASGQQLDLNAEGVTPIDNVEGITWGPVLDNGNRTLVLASDNNFNDTQVTEFTALEVTA